MYTTQTFPTRKQIALDIRNGVLTPHKGMILREMISRTQKEVKVAQKERDNTNKLKETYKELLPIIEDNIKYLKACLDLTEAHITWGGRNIKKKYSKIKTTLTNKMREQLIDKRDYTRFLES